MALSTRLSWLALMLALAAPAGRARAAQSYDNCTGFIDSLPASIGTQGTWCLRKHLFTSQAGGTAVGILADNVTIDCNDFRISGLGAGDATEAVGINTGPSRSNATVRNCRIQGFKYGVVLHGSHHLVEHNRFEANTLVGIHVSGAGLVIRRNLVADTGGYGDVNVVFGIDAGEGRVVDNTISGVRAVRGFDINGYPTGIALRRGIAQGNRVGGLLPVGAGRAVGIRATGTAVIRGNFLTQATPTPGVGIEGSGAGATICRENDIINFSNGAVGSCTAYANADQ